MKTYAAVPDIGRNVEIIRDGILHGCGQYKDKEKGGSSPAALINARVTINLVNILRTAIEVNRSSRGSNIDVPFTHIMLGVAGLENADGTVDYYGVRIEIEERVNRDPILVGVNVLGRLKAVNAKNKLPSRSGHRQCRCCPYDGKLCVQNSRSPKGCQA